MAQRYDTYKDSGVQWLGEIPGHWRCASMNKAIFDIRTGLNPRVHFMLNTEDANCYYVTIRELRGFDIITDSSTDRINNQAVERIPPPLSEQCAIVSYISERTAKIDKMVENVSKEIESIKEYKQRLISDVVTGQIKVC